MRIWKYGDNINTDMLFPGKYTYTCSTPEEIKPHLLEDLDPSFAGNVKKDDVIFAGKNFGCGSSREQPVLGLKSVGVQAIIAESFARIFYRSAINQGLVLIECPEAVKTFRGYSESLVLIECPEAVKTYSEGDEFQLNIEKGVITVGGKTFSFPTLPKEVLAIRDAGGLLSYIRLKLKKKSKDF